MPAADPDGDGWPNVIERMFSGDPQSAEPGLVEFQVVPDGELVAVELVRPSTLPEGGELIVELSRDLLLWDDLAELERSETWDDLGGGWGRYRARLTEFETISEPGVFGRLKVRFPEE
jgi:hypothetical protein